MSRSVPGISVPGSTEAAASREVSDVNGDTFNDEDPAQVSEMAIIQPEETAPPEEPSLFKRLIMARINQRLGINEGEDAYRQQMALQHFQDDQARAEDKALEWGDKVTALQGPLMQAQRLYDTAKGHNAINTPEYE